MAIMDRFRAKVEKQQVASPEEKKRQQRALLVPNVVSILLFLPMVVVGYQNEGKCDMNAPLYLLIGGGLGLGMTLLKIIAILTPSDCDDKFVNGLMPFAGLFSIGVTIWGSIVVFGAYSSWTYAAENKDNKDDELLYCPYTPFMLAFVLLIVEWVLKPFLLCCECLMACLSCCTGNAAKSTTEYEATATLESGEKPSPIIKQHTEKA